MNNKDCLCKFPDCKVRIPSDKIKEHWDFNHSEYIKEQNIKAAFLGNKTPFLCVTKSMSIIYQCNRCVDKFRSRNRYNEHAKKHGLVVTARKSTGGKAPRKPVN
jgi:uncharacterized C2H2 Zn-finger protein